MKEEKERSDAAWMRAGKSKCGHAWVSVGEERRGEERTSGVEGTRVCMGMFRLAWHAWKRKGKGNRGKSS